MNETKFRKWARSWSKSMLRLSLTIFRNSGKYLATTRSSLIILPLDQHQQTGGLVKIARWDDADPPHLVAHTPEDMDVRIKLESTH